MRTLILSSFAVMLAASMGLAEPCGPIRIAPPPIVRAVVFGGPVAVEGDFWFISDTNAGVLCGGDPFGCSAGAVHVYEMVDGVLEFRQMLTSPRPHVGDFYGRTIAIDDGRLVVGSLDTDWPGLEATGGAFVYEYDGQQWVEAGSIRPPAELDPVAVKQLGGFVTIEGDAVYIKPMSRSMVLSYALRDGDWVYRELIESPDGLPRDARFGACIEAGGGWVFIAAPDDSSLFHRGGSVYAYRREADGSLTFAQKIVPTDAPGGVEITQGFGSSTSFDGQSLAIGARGARRPGSSTGAVLIYELVDGEWTFQQDVVHPHAEYPDELGYDVKIHGDMLLATANGQASPIASSALHLFRRGADGIWGYAGQLVPNPIEYAYGYAQELATDGRFVLAGAVGERVAGEQTGAAYLFDLACGVCRPDLDADGDLTIFDFLSFFNLFEEGDPIADFDADGELTLFDFLAFQAAFDAGCE